MTEPESNLIRLDSDQHGGRKRILAFLVVVLLLAFLTTSMASFFVSKKTIRESIVTRELPLTSDTIYSEIQNDLMKPLLISSTMANDTFLRDWVLHREKNPAEISNYLSEIKHKYGTFSSFFVSDKTRTYYHANGILKTVKADEPRDAWYFRVRELKTPYEINVDPDMANRDAMTIFINYRVVDFNGNFIGATGVGLTVSMVKTRINDYAARYGRNVFFVDTAGKIVLSPDKGDIDGKNILNMPGIKDVAQQILDQQGTSFEYHRDGKQVLLNARYLPELHWYLLAEQTEDDSLQALRQVLIFNLFICVLVTLAVAAGIYRIVTWYQGRLEKRYAELAEQSQEIDSQKQLLENQSGELAESNRQLAALIREQEEFFGTVAHDLKSPLIGILGFSNLIKEGIAEGTLSLEEIGGDLEYIIKSSTDMSRLVENLLDIHVIEAGPDLRAETFDLCQVIRDAVEDFTFQAQSKLIDIRTVLPADSIHLDTDKDWVETVLKNLLSNAIKFSSEKTSVTVEAFIAGEHARITVQDQGPGIAAEEQDRLFKRFSRLSNQPTGGENSTGLGLYIVKKVTEQLGGTVACASEPGHGASFIIELPVAGR